MRRRSPVEMLRYITVAVLLLLACGVFCARLVDLQLRSEAPSEGDGTETYTRTETIEAERGEIYDRNGVPLVTNSYTRSIIFDYGDMPWGSDATNRLILSCIRAIRASDGEGALTQTPYFPFDNLWGEGVYYLSAYLPDGDEHFRLVRMLSYYELPEDTEAAAFRDFLLERWGMKDADGKLLYEKDEATLLFMRRYDMVRMQFSPSSPYILEEKASIGAISAVLELNLRGVKTRVDNERVYQYPGYMSHILGLTGKIPSDEYESYKEQGYAMDATVGVSGVEKAFESLLRGTAGEITVVEDREGNTISRTVTKEPVAGKDVYLTIDIRLQLVAEDSLAYRVQKVASDGEASANGQGADANAGAVVAIEPVTNGVLCLASYPTFDLTTVEENYTEVANDKNAPLLNRVLNATYPPGSTFKLCTAAAALSEGTITLKTTIQDKGVYRYYNDYQPHCWVYDMSHTTHGTINVVGAIRDSCNYFFFETGRLLGIEKLDVYANALGLGRATGIELPEKTGILAGPEYVETSGIGLWMPGDTLAASIGQSYHLFTPMQLSCYLSALLNNGTRYGAHLLCQTVDFATGEATAYERREMDGCISLDTAYVNAIKSGMREVMNAALTVRAFKDLTAVQAAGKTGTAQLGGTGSDNAVFVSFAPYGAGEPEIVVAGIIENGVTGNNTAYVISDIMEQFFQGEAHIG